MNSDKSTNEKTEKTEKTETHEAKAEVVENQGAALVDTLFDVALSWAEFGVGQGKRALDQSARTLERVAQLLEQLQGRLRKNAS